MDASVSACACMRAHWGVGEMYFYVWPKASRLCKCECVRLHACTFGCVGEMYFYVWPKATRSNIIHK